MWKPGEVTDGGCIDAFLKEKFKSLYRSDQHNKMPPWITLTAPYSSSYTNWLKVSRPKNKVHKHSDHVTFSAVLMIPYNEVTVLITCYCLLNHRSNKQAGDNRGGKNPTMQGSPDLWCFKDSVRLIHRQLICGHKWGSLVKNEWQQWPILLSITTCPVSTCWLRRSHF